MIAAMTTPLERTLESRLGKYCRKVGILYIKGKATGQKGFPDRMLIRGGKVLFLELKRKGCKPLPTQVYWMKQLQYAGVKSEWADNYDDAVKIIEETFA
jgi:hypothetical protein